MKENIYDLALEGISEIIEEVSESISREFKGTKPFDKEAISDEEMLYDYNTRGFEIFSQLADSQGLAQAVEYRDKMEEIKLKREEVNAKR